MIKKVINGFIILLLLINISPAAFAQIQSAPSVGAQNIVMLNTNTGAIIYSTKPDERIYPASLTKLVSLLTAVELIEDYDAVITVTDDCYDDLVVGSSNMALKDGEEIKISDLLYGIALSSANEASNALAIYLCGSVKEFVKLMNQKAAQLGALNTNFVNTHGLQDENHYTTAKDMSIIASAAFANKKIKELLSTTSHTIEPTNKTLQKRSVVTTNNLIKSTAPSYYKYAVAGKTGSTTAAGYNLVSIAVKGNVEMLLVAMNVPRANGNTVFADSRSLYIWAFENFVYSQIISEKNLVKEIEVELSAKVNSLVLTPENSVMSVIPKDMDVATLEQHVEAESSVKAPIAKGEVLGKLTLKKDDVVYGEVNLVSKSDIERSTVLYYLYLIEQFFSNIWVRLVCALLGIILILYITVMVSYNRRRKRSRLRRRIKF